MLKWIGRFNRFEFVNQRDVVTRKIQSVFSHWGLSDRGRDQPIAGERSLDHESWVGAGDGAQPKQGHGKDGVERRRKIESHDVASLKAQGAQIAQKLAGHSFGRREGDSLVAGVNPHG